MNELLSSLEREDILFLNSTFLFSFLSFFVFVSSTPLIKTFILFSSFLSNYYFYYYIPNIGYKWSMYNWVRSRLNKFFISNGKRSIKNFFYSSCFCLTGFKECFFFNSYEIVLRSSMIIYSKSI